MPNHQKPRSIKELTLSEIWEFSPTGGSLDINLRESGGEGGLVEVNDKQANRRDQHVTIVGKMPYDKPTIFYGWYVQDGIAKIWSAYGSEKLCDIYGKVKHVL